MFKPIETKAQDSFANAQDERTRAAAGLVAKPAVLNNPSKLYVTPFCFVGFIPRGRHFIGLAIHHVMPL